MSYHSTLPKSGGGGGSQVSPLSEHTHTPINAKAASGQKSAMEIVQSFSSDFVHKTAQQ